MNSDEFAKLREIFHRCCEVPKDQQEAALDLACEGNEELRSMVRDLLQAESQHESMVEAGSDQLAKQLLKLEMTDRADRADHAEQMPLQIGPYKVIRVLGEGGMGVAYLAEQSNPQREVAIKVLKSGVVSASMRSRFAREVRVLGRLSHPGIARILEAGFAQTPHGPLSYFAMEYVAGSRITTFAQEHSLDARARLELIAKVADAVQHAHSSGIIHRDLKPANIVVKGVSSDAKTGGTTRTGETSGPTPVILDFGVARMLEAETGDSDQGARTAMTEAGVLIGTIGYMSPEQLAGGTEGIDARTDIYSLGVLLFELLAGRAPFELQGKPVAEAARIVRDEEPRSLEARGEWSIRGVVVDGDIRTIVQHAMAKDRDRRYATAAALADDVRRYLSDQPILARPATLSYQLSKFAKRHRSLVGGTLIALLALVVGLGVSIALYVRAEYQRARADEREKRASSLQEFMVENLLKAPAPDRLGQDATMIDALLAAREELDARFVEQPQLEGDVRASLADVLGTIGKVDESVEEWEKVVALLERTRGPDDEQTVSALIDLAATTMLAQKPKKGAELAADALARARKAQPTQHVLIIRALTQIGRADKNRAAYGAARKAFVEALEIAQQDPERFSSNVLSLRCSIMECEQGMRRPEAALEMNKLITEQLRQTDLQGDDRVHAVLSLITNNLANKRVAEAVVLADGVAPLIETAIPITRRGFCYRVLVRAYLAASRYEDA
ncbi:MAG: serine/threonine-protein kinase, partial [Planctomycetota bacterium]|nr:serine/threonine-protein kinase [Planctomycetota bacterium]